MFRKITKYAKGLIDSTLRAARPEQVMLPSEGNLDGWTVIITDVFGNVKLRITYPSRAKGQAAKKAIMGGKQLYDVKLVDERDQV